MHNIQKIIELFNISNTELNFIILSLLSLTIILIFYLYFFRSLFFYKETNGRFNSGVSVIVCARNEYSNLKKNLHSLLSQSYENYEVIVVNDKSTDKSKEYLKELSGKYNKLQIVNIDDHIDSREGKKFALTLGIKTAKYEHILLTDADCTPRSNNWINEMCNSFDSNDIILGFGAYKKNGGLLNKFIRFDTFNVALYYFSFSIKNLTYMGVGRNLAYKKSIFFDNKGFAKHMHIASGDDDLFIQEVASNKNINIKLNKLSHTTSESIDKWKDWLFQKRRHISTSSHYKLKFKILLSILPFFTYLYFFSIIVLIILKAQFVIILSLILPKIIFSYVINYKIMKKLDCYDLYFLHPIYEILYLLLQCIFMINNIVDKPKKWKR